MSSVDCVNHDVPIAPHTIPPIPTKSRIVIRLTTDREQQSAIMIFGFKMNFFRYFSMKSLFKCLVCYINFVKFFCGFLKSKYFPVLLVLYIYIYIYIYFYQLIKVKMISSTILMFPLVRRFSSNHGITNNDNQYSEKI